MRSNILLHLTPMALLLATGAPAWSQQTMGVLSGTVKSQAGGPIAKARIILSSPALFAARTLATSASGEWRAVGLPPGSYRIQVFAEGFVGSEVRDVRVGLGASVAQDLSLKPVAVQNVTVEVVDASAELDKSETKTYSNFSSDRLESLPSLDRGFFGAADLTPGVTMSQNGAPAVRGGTTQDTAFRINGTDVQDDYQGGIVGRYYIEDNIEDVQVMLSPLNARFGRNTGGAVNAVTKTGGNEFTGSVRATVSRLSWNASTPFTSAQNTQVGSTNREYQVTVAGPIIKDRLWFSLGTILTPQQMGTYSWYAPSFTPSIMRTGDANVDAVTGKGPSAFGFASGYASQMFPGVHTYGQPSNESYYDAKITGSLSETSTLELSVVHNTLDIKERGAWWSDVPILRKEDATSQKDRNTAITLNYRGVFSSQAYVDAGFNAKYWRMTPPQGDPAYGNAAQVYLYADRPAGDNPYWFMGSAWTYGTPPKEERNNQRAWININLFRTAGTTEHELDLGAEYNKSTHVEGSQFGANNEIVRVGGSYQLGSANDFLFPTIVWPGRSNEGQSPNGAIGLAPVMRIYTGKDGTHKNDSTSVYANDNWVVNQHFQAMFGLRYDQERVYDIDGRKLASASQLSPRLQLRWDMGGDNKRLVTLTAARFGGDFSTGFTTSFVQSARSAYTSFGWSGIGNQPQAGTSGDLVNGQEAYGVRFVNFSELTNPANYTGNNGATAFQAWNSSLAFKLSDDLKPPTMDEVTIGLRRNFGNGDFIRLTGVYRTWRHIWAFATDWAPDQMVTLPDPTGHLHDQYTPAIRVFNSDDIHRNYHSLEMEFKQTITSVWSLSGSYTYSRLTGNTEDGQQSGSTFRDTAITEYYDQRRMLTNTMHLSNDAFDPDGRLVNDQSNRGRLIVMGDYPVGKGRVTTSWILQYDSGNPWSATNAASLGSFGSTPAYTSAAPVTYTKYYGGRGQYTFNDNYTVNFKVAWQFPLPLWKVKLFGSLSAANLFNHIIQTGYNTTIWTNSNGANALWLDPTIFGKADPSVANYWNAGRSYEGSVGLRF
jgi:hypothetical protein